MSEFTKLSIEYIDDAFEFTGPQLQSNALVKMRCEHRGDGGSACFIFNGKRVNAIHSNIHFHEERGQTCVSYDGVVIKHVEHILSALFATNSLDTDITLSYDGVGDESIISVPVASLSSREFTHAINTCFHRREQKNGFESIFLDKCYFFRDETDVGNKDPSFAIFSPHNSLHITTQINFPHFWGQQVYSLALTPEEYMHNISWARSFLGFPFSGNVDWEKIRSRFPGIVRERENMYRSLLLMYTQTEWITPVIVETEPVRHKMLDFIGDLALLGKPIKACIHIYKPSHKFNRDCVTKLAEAML